MQEGNVGVLGALNEFEFVLWLCLCLGLGLLISSSCHVDLLCFE